jgi:hypothetical protein
MSEDDEIKIQQILLGNLAQVQTKFFEDEHGNRHYLYSQDIADYFQKAYDDYTKIIWEKHERNIKSN